MRNVSALAVVVFARCFTRPPDNLDTRPRPLHARSNPIRPLKKAASSPRTTGTQSSHKATLVPAHVTSHYLLYPIPPLFVHRPVLGIHVDDDRLICPGVFLVQMAI